MRGVNKKSVTITVMLNVFEQIRPKVRLSVAGKRTAETIVILIYP